MCTHSSRVLHVQYIDINYIMYLLFYSQAFSCFKYRPTCHVFFPSSFQSSFYLTNFLHNQTFIAFSHVTCLLLTFLITFYERHKNLLLTSMNFSVFPHPYSVSGKFLDANLLTHIFIQLMTYFSELNLLREK